MQDKNIDKVLEIVNSFVIGTEFSCNDIDEDLLQHGLDSVIFVRIIVSLEENFEIEIPDEYFIMSKIDTISKLTTLVSELEGQTSA